MKKSQIILFVIFLVITGLIYFFLSRNKKEYSKEMKEQTSVVYLPVRTVENQPRTMTITSYGQVSPVTELIVSFEVQGKLQKGDIYLKPGTRFSKGQILYKIDNEEAFYSLSARKANLATLILNALPDIELDFPKEVSKWSNFMKGLHPAKMLPELPSFSSEKERMFITGRNIVSDYYNLKSTEVRLSKYFFAAPFSGTVVDTYAEPGTIINPGVQVAKIAKTGDYEVKVPMDLDDLEIYRKENQATFMTTNGEKIGTGKIIRVSDVINQQTQSADVYFSIQPDMDVTIYNGLFVNVTVNKAATKESMILPETAVKDGKVMLLKDEKLNPTQVLIVSSKPDSVFVTGLSDGETVVLEQVTKKGEGIRYEGVKR